MAVYFETKRYVVRPYWNSDLDELFQVMSDARVHTYTKDKNRPWDIQRTEAYLQFMIERDFQTLECFHGAIIEKSTSRLIGLCGLNPYREKEPEIEWKIGVPYWNKGCATELGKQLIQEAFGAGGVKGIYGMAQPENTASRRVLEKIGMNHLGKQIFRDQEYSFYYIANQFFLPVSRRENSP